MQRSHSRSVAQTARLSTEEYVGLWSAALWVLAAAFILATFQVY